MSGVGPRPCLDAEDIERVKDAHPERLVGQELRPEGLFAQLHKPPRLKHQCAPLLQMLIFAFGYGCFPTCEFSLPKHIYIIVFVGPWRRTRT